MMNVSQKFAQRLVSVLLGVFILSLSLVITGLMPMHPGATFAAPVEGAGNKSPAMPAVSVPANTANDLNPNPPTEVAKLVFIHHSVGNNWLDAGNGDLGDVLGANNYYVSDTYYEWGPDEIGSNTDFGHWWLWFRGTSSSTYLTALYSTTNQNAEYTRPMVDPSGENEIVLFKSCYPNSYLHGEPDEPPTEGDNPLRGQPYSSEYHTVGNAKGIYNDILEYFATRQDKLFIVITAPPIRYEDYNENIRAFNNWLVYDWLDDYPYNNVAVFDFFTVLTTNGGDPDTNDYGWATGNHHRLVSTTLPVRIEHIYDGDDDENPNILEYPSEGGTDSHPSVAGNQKATGEFIPLLNVYYNCWKYNQCGDETTEWINVTAMQPAKTVVSGEPATFTLSVNASAGISGPVTLALQGVPGGAPFAFVPNPVTPPGTSHLVITTTDGVPIGISPMTVTAAAGDISSTTALTLTVNPTLTLSAQPHTAMVVAGDTATYTLFATASPDFGAPVTLTLQGAPGGVTSSFSPNHVSLPITSTLMITTTPDTTIGTYLMTAVVDAGTVSRTVNLTLTVGMTLALTIQPESHTVLPGEAAIYNLTVATSAGFSGPVTLTAQGAPSGATVTLTPNPINARGTGNLTITTLSSTQVGDYAITVTADAGPVQSTAFATLTVRPELSLGVMPTVQTVSRGETAVYTLSIAASQGFFDPVLLTSQGAPLATVSFAPNPVTPPGESHLLITTTTSTASGIYPMTVTAESEAVSKTATITLVVVPEEPPSYTLEVLPNINHVSPGGTVTYTVSITSVSTFLGPVTLSAVGLPEQIQTSWSLNPALPGSTSVLTCTVTNHPPFGEHPFTVVGIAGDQVAVRNAILIIDPYKVYLPLVLKGVASAFLETH
jgi:hypothetical protein